MVLGTKACFKVYSEDEIGVAKSIDGRPTLIVRPITFSTHPNGPTVVFQMQIMV